MQVKVCQLPLSSLDMGSDLEGNLLNTSLLNRKRALFFQSRVEYNIVGVLEVTNHLMHGLIYCDD